MEEEYDYSMYTTLCTIDICPVENFLLVHAANNRTSTATVRFAAESYLEVPLGFYYNKDNGMIIYGTRMMHHYKQHPPRENYVHVSNFVQELYALYKRSRDGESPTQDDIALRAAIASFLTKVYPSRLSDHKKSSTMQYVFILPSQEHTNKDFVNTTLRPLLQTTPWSALNDLPSKTVFYSTIDTYAYMLNRTRREFRLERENKYLFCTLQRSYNPNRLLLTMTFTRAVYDPDLIVASKRSITALGGSTILSLKSISPSLTLDIPTQPTVAKIDRLAQFLYNKIFAGEDEDSTPTQLEEYYTSRYSNSLIHRIIVAIAFWSPWDHWSTPQSLSEEIEGAFSSWPNKLYERVKSRIPCINLASVLQLFDDDMEMSTVESKIASYLQQYENQEIYQNIIISKYGLGNALIKINPYGMRDLTFAEIFCQYFYTMKAQTAVACFLGKQRKGKRTIKAATWLPTVNEGCAYKILDMVQLANRSGWPVVINTNGNNQQEISKAEPVAQKDKLALIEKIQPYGYYVEANISCSNEIKMSLSQVIETTTKDGKLQRSTLSIMDSTHQASNMYDSIFDTLWNMIHEHLANPQCKSLRDDKSTVYFKNYRTIKVELIDAFKNSMVSKSNSIRDLDEVIYCVKAKLNCSCDLLITHRLVMDYGLLPYLQSIAGEIVSPLKAKTIFGNYKISCLTVTGEFVYNLLEQTNSTYGEYAWSHLKTAIISALNDKQLRIHLMMKKSMVLKDRNLDYRPFKLERYKQVSSKQYYLNTAHVGSRLPKLYHDEGDHWVQVPFITRVNDVDSAIPLLLYGGQVNAKCCFKKVFHLIVYPEDFMDDFNYQIKLVALSADALDDVDKALSFNMNIVLVASVQLPKSPETKLPSAFPLTIEIMPRSYISAIDLTLQMGIYDFSLYSYAHVAYCEQLTLEAL